MSAGDLPVNILQNVRHRALQHTDAPAAACWVGVKSDGVLSHRPATTASFNSKQAHVFVRDERMEQTDRVRTAADAGEQGVRQFSDLEKNLFSRFAPDPTLHFPHPEG